MIKKNLLKFVHIIWILFLFTTINQAQNSFITLNMSDGSRIIYPLENIKKITFDNITNINDSKKISGLVKSFNLLQNYPNPFNPTTSIDYQIPQKGTVEIRIFNINGKLINSIFKDHNKEGHYSVKWDGRNEKGKSVASGLYFYQARFENSVISKRMIFLK